MPKLIVTSRYLKSGSGKKKQLYHYVKYIATREGSVPIPNANETAPATKNQQELISSLLNDFPDSKELFEYEDYQKDPTVKNGSALISEILDRNMDRLTSRENYVAILQTVPEQSSLVRTVCFHNRTNLLILKRLQKRLQTMAVTFGLMSFRSAEITLRQWGMII